MMQQIRQYDWQQISLRQRVSPFPNYLSMECIQKEMQQTIGAAFKVGLWLFRNNVVRVTFDGKDYDRVARHILARVNKNPRVFQKLIRSVRQYAPGFISFTKNVSSKDLSAYSDRQLYRICLQYERLYKRIYALYFPALAVDELLLQQLRAILYEKVPDRAQATQHLQTLITEPKAMVAKQEKRAALKLACVITHKPTWKRALFLRTSEKRAAAVHAIPDLRRRIRAHERDWYWVTRDYEDPVLTFADILDRVATHLREHPCHQYRTIDREWRTLPQLRRVIERNIRVGVHERALFRAARDSQHLKELRKSIVSKSLVNFDSILREIGRRGKLTLNQVRHLRTQDIRKALLEQKDFKREAQQRIKLSVFFVKRGQTAVLTGARARSLVPVIEKKAKHSDLITGYPAAPGKVRGKVRHVMNPSDGHKLKRGEVLVTGQAVPSFAPFLSRASALVAEGGTAMTSHPATLAREAGIPCVTGAQHAMKVLKNGDRVEVDGDQGVVRKL